MASAFYNHGCSRSGLLRSPVVLAQRLLRRLQRPLHVALQQQLDDLTTETRALGGQLAAANRDILALRSQLDGTAAQLGTALENSGLHALGLADAVNNLERSARAATVGYDKRPLRVLFALSSTSQMYSGIGRAIFETVKRCRGRIEYTFAMDDAAARNRDLLADFCRTERLTFHVSKALELPHCLDRVGDGLARLIERGGWDAIECVSFANTSTNAAVLKHAGGTPIVYTPHYQPLWTVPGDADVYKNIAAVHNTVVRSAALVSCDSPWEWLMLRAQAGPRTDCALLPLGFEPNDFVAGPPNRKPYLLFVGDLNEVRKRFPLALQIFAEVNKQLPHFQLVVVGNKSDLAGHEVPEHIRRQVVLKGYVGEPELRQLYREAAGLLQPTEFEAFGLPILEALACGTPVFLSRRPTVTGIFGRYQGIVLMDDAAPDRMAEAITTCLRRGPAFIEEVIADRVRLAAELSWDVLTDRRIQAMRAVTKLSLRAAHAA